jgi:hypothetical protein
MAEAGKNSVGSGGSGVSADVFEFKSRNVGSIGDGSFATSGSCGKSGHMGSTGSGDFGSVLDGLWGTPDGNGFQMAKAGNDSISGGSDGVSADMFEFGSGHIGGILNGSFTTGSSGVSGQMSGTSCSYFRCILNGLRDSPSDDLQRWKGRNDSVGGSSGRMGAVMFDFSGPDFGSVQNGTGLSPNRNGLSGDDS